MKVRPNDHFPLYFSPKLEIGATCLRWLEYSDILLVTPEVLHTQP